MWAKLYDVSGVTGGGLSGARLQVWQEETNYKLTVLDDANGNNGTYMKVAKLTNSASTPLELIEFEEIDGTKFYYKPQTQDEGVIYVTPSGISIVTE